MIQFALYQYRGGPLLADYSGRVQGATVASNNRGYAECKGFIPLSLADSFWLYDRRGLPHVAFNDSSSGAFYEGRLEDVNLAPGGVNFTAYGYSQALGDFLYSALWSDTKVDSFRAVDNTEISNARNEQWTITTGVGAVAFQPNKNCARGTTPTPYVGYMIYQIPDRSSRLITGMSFDWLKFHGTGSVGHQWTGQVLGYGAGFTSPVLLFSTGAGTDTGSVNLTFSGVSYIVIEHVWDGPNSDGPNPNETGAILFLLRNIRIVTSIANRINTTLTANRAAGTNVTATVGSTARMYAGQRLQIGGTTSESVVVLSIGSATQFNATFLQSYVIGNTVQAHVTYADEIVNDMVTTVATANATQLNSSLALIQSPAFDLTDRAFVDTYHKDVLDTLAGLPDTQARLWEWGVYGDQRLYFRPQSTAGRTWYIDVSELDIQRTLSALWNNVYATYQDANGKRLRGTPTVDLASITRYGVNRQQALNVSTTSATQASAQAAAALADSKDPAPRANLVIDKVYDGNGVRWPLQLVKAGDTIIIRNLPPTLSTAIDKIRIFRATRAEYAIDTDTLAIEPETPLPTLDVLIAQQALRS